MVSRCPSRKQGLIFSRAALCSEVSSVWPPATFSSSLSRRLYRVRIPCLSNIFWMVTPRYRYPGHQKEIGTADGSRGPETQRPNPESAGRPREEWFAGVTCGWEVDPPTLPGRGPENARLILVELSATHPLAAARFRNVPQFLSQLQSPKTFSCQLLLRFGHLFRLLGSAVGNCLKGWLICRGIFNLMDRKGIEFPRNTIHTKYMVKAASGCSQKNFRGKPGRCGLIGEETCVLVITV